ncbi:lytic transglycosylase domain-containing protein [uncultured Helicobacter sp.]|uniref:lytic transglycosylase domain-containing protein n=1 Tax=uncultured Helicobacter sp. TaxID=175537 RepID=UPI00374F99FE
MSKRFALICVLLGVLGAQAVAKEIDIKFLESKPKGLARDFYIWRFLSDENTSLQDALKAYELVHRKTPKLKALLEQKGMPHELPRDLQCARLDFKTLLAQDLECVSYGLKLSQVPHLSPQNLKALKAKIAPNKNLSTKVEILSSKTILTKMLQSDAKTFAQIYNSLTQKQRETLINQTIKPQRLKKLANENTPAFDKMLQGIILSDSLPRFKKSLLNAHITKASPYTLFLLGINELMAKNTNNALAYFRLAQSTSKDTFLHNKALFWQYLVSKDKKLLSKLAQSTNVDIYTIYANQKLQSTPQYTIITDFTPLSKKKPPFNIQDPFEWEILRANLLQVSDTKALDELTQEFAFVDSLAHMAYVHNRATRYQNNYFLSPFAQKIKWKNTDQKALTYAIARQESNFLPALISTSYALGMMQIMPFNVVPFAKSMGLKDIKLEDMFNPVIALEFGRFYLGELEREFKHPLFVAYAYNGGPGFLRRTLGQKKLFIKNRKYEPWLSMELIPYEESRIYGLKVLANYIVYEELFGNNITLEQLLKTTLIN